MRAAVAAKRSPGPFHCLACQTYVIGTEAGHCPRCGFVPPSAPAVPVEPRPVDGQLLLLALLLVLAAAIAIAC